MISAFLHVACIIVGFETAFGFREFNTYTPMIASRRTTYNPYVISKTCYLIPDRGPCRGNIPMYYFDSTIRNCSMFRWGGCQGNGNRFDTMQECNKYCLSGRDHKRGRPEYCSLTFDYGFCFGAVDRWYYDSLWKVCKKGLYSGCGGNKNNFKMEEQCIAKCRLGNPSLIKAGAKKWVDGHKKIIIINPLNASTKLPIQFVTRMNGSQPNQLRGQTSNPDAPPEKAEIVKVLDQGEKPEYWGG